MTDTSRPPDHDPAGTSFPRWERTTVPAFKRQVDAIGRMASTEYERGALDMGLRVLRALEAGRGPEVLGTLRALTYRSPDHVDAVLRSLDALTDRAPEDGEQE